MYYQYAPFSFRGASLWSLIGVKERGWGGRSLSNIFLVGQILLENRANHT
jgi:hypothetical protein